MIVLRINMKHGRYFVDVIVSCSGEYARTKCLIDTGAQVSSVPIGVLQRLSKAQIVEDNVGRKGIVPGAVRLYSKYLFDITIDTLVLRDTPILIPKDSGVFMPLLGIDILSQLDFSQLGCTYQINVREPQAVMYSKWVNYSNVNDALMYILKEKKRTDLFSVLHQYIPVDINMQFDNFYVLVSSMMRKLHMT